MIMLRYVRLPNGDLVMSIILYWAGAHASPNPAVAGVAQSVVAFKATDGAGLIWDYCGTILDAASWPSSEEVGGGWWPSGRAANRSSTAPPGARG